MTFLKKWWWTLPLVLLLMVAGFVIWASLAAAPMPEALIALQADPEVRVEIGQWITFSPVDSDPESGFIFYPGGRVDPRAYAPAMRELAAQGYLCVIVPMPLNLAVLAPWRAAGVMTAFPEIDHWVLGGHSLGGAMAANFVFSNAAAVDGLALWASYPAANNDLSGFDGLEVISIFGDRDGLADVATVEESHGRLPGNTHFIEIVGGNHAQFGWYGSQAGDNEAAVSREEQQRLIVKATMDLLARVSAGR
jgi:pimeloyl-ACP methyl ester carboxylesterase